MSLSGPVHAQAVATARSNDANRVSPASPTEAPPAVSAAPAATWTAADAHLVVTAERMTGVVWSHSTTTNDSVYGHFEQERTGTQFHALAASGSTGDGEDGVTFSSIPRITIDFVLPMDLTLGAIAGVMSTSGKEDPTIDGEAQTRVQFPDTTTLLLGGRLGYVWALSDSVAFWPRVGCIYASQVARGSAGTEQTIRSTQLIIDPALVLTPVPHVGILFYPIIDVGLGGSITKEFSVSGLDRQRSDGSYRSQSYGGALGLSAFF